jgi:hypothetical protein
MKHCMFKTFYYIKYSALKRFRALIKVIISHVRLFMIISHVKIIAFQLSLFCKKYRFSKTVLYIINRKIHGCLEIPDLFLVLNMISHSFAALTRELSCSTLEIKHWLHYVLIKELFGRPMMKAVKNPQRNS